MFISLTLICSADKISDSNPPKINVGSASGKIEIIFQKQAGSELRWPNLGTPLTGNNSFVTCAQFESRSFDEYRTWTLVSREPVTHDVDHYVFEPPKHMVSLLIFFVGQLHEDAPTEGHPSNLTILLS